MDAFHWTHTNLFSHKVKSLTHSLSNIYITFVYHIILIISMTFMIFWNDSKWIRSSIAWSVWEECLIKWLQAAEKTNNNNNNKWKIPSNFGIQWSYILYVLAHTHAHFAHPMLIATLSFVRIIFQFLFLVHSLFFHNLHFLYLFLSSC